MSPLESIISSQSLENILDEIVTPRLEKIGLTKRSKGKWYGNTKNHLRYGVTYIQIKGAQGTFIWGANIDFIPVISNGKLNYYKTDKKYLMHLWEGTTEYKNSFSGAKMKKGIASHWGLKEANKTISSLFNRYSDSISKWFNEADSYKNLIAITEKQIKPKSTFYNIHFPHPAFILPFLYAKEKQMDTALKLFEELPLHHFENKMELHEKTKKKLVELETLL